jgi:acyl-CoA dehydrogenase
MLGLFAWVFSNFVFNIFPFWLNLGTSIALFLFVTCFVFRPIRRFLLTKNIFKKFTDPMPKVFDYELEALRSGTSGFEAELFSGKPNWNKFKKSGKPTLSDEERKFIEGPVSALCRELDEWTITHLDNDLPESVWKFIKDNGFFGLIIPKEYGGKAFSAYAQSLIISMIAARSVTAAVTVGVPNSLGPAELLLRYGTEAQKKQYLTRLAKGIDVPCFGLTHPEAGSDAHSIPDLGVVCQQEFEGKETLGFRINCNKRYITLAPVATLVGLAFQVSDPEHLLGDKEHLGITFALLPADTKGLTIGRRHCPQNVAFQNGPIEGKDVFVPLEWVVGGKECIGQGWKMVMECLSIGRAITLPSIAVGGAQLSSFVAGAYASVRRQFGLPLYRFEGIGEKLAEIAAMTYTMQAARDFTVAQIDQGQEPAIASAITKYHLTELARVLGNHSMDILAGKAICLGPKNYIAYSYQAIPIGITVEGANILTRNLIIFGQGSVRCHRYSFRLFESILARDLKSFDKYFFRSVGQTFSNVSRALLLGFTSGRIQLFSIPKGKAKRYYQKLGRYSAAFSLLAETFMFVLGPALKRTESLSARLGDILSYLYLVSCTLRQFDNDGQPQEEFPIIEWVCQHYFYKIQETMLALFENAPSFLFKVIKPFVFPFGARALPPNDALTHELATHIASDSPLRNRLIKTMNPSVTPLFHELDQALTFAKDSEPALLALRIAVKKQLIPEAPLEKQLPLAVGLGVITAEQSDCLQAARELMLKVIAVDDFPPSSTLSKSKSSSNEKLYEPKKSSEEIK